VTVFQVPDLSGDLQVDASGNISMPLVGAVKAADRTVAELEADLKSKLGEKYLQHPDVSVSVKDAAGRKVTVDGSVKLPGMYSIFGPTSLLQAVAMAHGEDENANPHRVAIFRQIQGQRMAAAFDLTRIRHGLDQDPPIYSGDVVVVDGSKTKEAERQLLNSIPLLSLFRPF